MHSFDRLLATTLLLLPGAPALAQQPPLVLFGDLPARGLWRMKSPSLPTRRCSIATQCSAKALQDTKALSRTERTCADGLITRVTLTRESAKVLPFEAAESGGQPAPLRIEGRYAYQGPCAEDQSAGRFQVDKNSAMCAQLRA